MFAFKNSFIPPHPFFKKMKASKQSARIKEHKSLGKVPQKTKHYLLKHKQGCCVWVQQQVKELNDRRILTALTLSSWHWLWWTDCVFCSYNELYSVCVTCQQLICLLDALANCSVLISRHSHSSPWFGFIYPLFYLIIKLFVIFALCRRYLVLLEPTLVI